MGFNRIFAGAIALIALLAILTAAFAYSELGSAAKARYWVNHSHQVLERTEGLLTLIQRAENSERGLLITHDSRYLDGFQGAAAALPKAGAELAALTADRPDQSERVARLNQTISVRLRALATSVALAQAGDDAAARRNETATMSRADATGIREQVEALEAKERVLLDERRRKAAGVDERSLYAGLAVAGLALLGLTAAIFDLGRVNRGLSRALAEAARATAERRASDALTQAVFANSPDYLLVLEATADDRFLVADINPAFARALNMHAEAVRGQDLAALASVATRDAIIALCHRVREADRPILTRDVLEGGPSGPVTWESVLAPVKSADGAHDRIVISIRDITERERTENRLREAHRMEAIGQLTGGVAHDFNNLLQVIRGNLELLEPMIAENATARRRLANALHGADRAAQLTHQLLAFARRQPLAPQVINLSRLVSEMSELLRRTLGEAVAVETIIGPELWNTLADPAQVESAILNLAINARDAMPAGGRLKVEVSNVTLTPAEARTIEGASSGDYVRIVVSDTGEGMAPETLARAFEPFFTTKGAGKGSGLGLAMVYGFVRQSEGHVRIASDLGRGTAVEIYLPRSEGVEAAAEAPAQASPPEPGTGQLILVVEDQASVRAAAVATLGELGYRCVEAGDAAAALRLAASGPAIDLVFTDVVMPGPVKTGEFLERIRLISPEVPILFTSGFADETIVQGGRLNQGVKFLPKPYGRDDLARKVAAILAHPHA